MKKIPFLFLLLSICVAGEVQAQDSLWAVISNSLKRGIVPGFFHVQKPAPLKETDWAFPCDRMLSQYASSSFNPEEASPEVIAENDRLYQQARKNWRMQDLFAWSQPAVIKKGVTAQALTSIAWEDYFPAEVRLVFLGEYHENDWIIDQVEQAMLALAKMNPDKRIYYVSEFVDATPGKGEVYVLANEEDVYRLVRKRPYYHDITRYLLEEGFRVVGLEDPSISQRMLEEGMYNRNSGTYASNFRDTALGWDTVSAYGLKMRNLYWKDIIQRIYAYDPAALVVVHLGKAHANYNFVSPLSLMLQEYKPFVVEFSTANKQLEKNTLLDRHFPFNLEKRNKPKEGKPTYCLRWMKDPRVARVAGADLNIMVL